MNQVAILNTTHFANKGSMGRIEGMIRCLDRTMPGTEITIFHRYFKQDNDTISKKLMETYPNLIIKEHPWFKEESSNIMTAATSLIRFGSLTFSHILNLRSNPIKELKNYDVVLDLNFIEPDKLTDKYDLVSAVGNFFALLNVWYATRSKIPVMICSATVGPYYNRFLRDFARHILNKTNIITLREEYSQIYLSNIGVNRSHIELSADLAFLMEPPNTDKLKDILKNLDISYSNRPLIGITPAAMANSSLPEAEYIELISELSEYLIENFNATLIYIANTYQDVAIAQKICQSIKNAEQAKILPFALSASETKGVIGICDLFICSRFHALVASTSLGVPSIGLVSYSHNKFHGIIGKMMDQEDYLLDIGPGFQYDNFMITLKQKACYLLNNSKSVSQKLCEQGEKVKSRTLLNGLLIKNLISSSRS